MRRLALANILAGLAIAMASTSAAHADMAIINLTKVNTQVIEKQGWTVRKQRARMTLFCNGCREFTATDIMLERATDGTEARIRKGETTAKTMLNVCKQNANRGVGGSCYGVTPIKLKGAVGFLNDVSLGPMGFASTYVLWQDDRRLTIRNVASSRQAARQNGRVMFRALAPQIVR